jgi:4-hydroxybenzoate polyprenyltransferase
MPDASAAKPVQLLRLVRPTQWAKSVFVLIGPFYALADEGLALADSLWRAVVAAIAFSLASSAMYIVNDILDAEADRAHPRKRNRPIASGAVSPREGAALSGVLVVLAGAAVFLLPETPARLWLGAILGAYVLNVAAYSVLFKHHIIADVMSLSIGFVLRVFAGCVAIAVTPSVWLLNCTLFLAMFLAFGKRLGERRTLGAGAGAARRVQAAYTDDLLRMAVVVTGVATLMGYTIYVQAQDAYVFGFNLLWLTVLPATYVLLRTVVVIEQGRYDDPTELAVRDRGFQAGAAVFALLTAYLVWTFRLNPPP